MPTERWSDADTPNLSTARCIVCEKPLEGPSMTLSTGCLHTCHGTPHDAMSIHAGFCSHACLDAARARPNCKDCMQVRHHSVGCFGPWKERYGLRISFTHPTDPDLSTSVYALPEEKATA